MMIYYISMQNNDCDAPQPREVQGVWDVYASAEDKEIHDLIIKLKLSERDGNHLLQVLRKVRR